MLGDVVFASHRLDVTAIRPNHREHWREQWFEEVERQLCGCSLVFADPDNGLVGDEQFKPGRKESTKRIPLFEANALAEGRTAVIYHHNSRAKGGHLREIRRWMDEVRGCPLAWHWQRLSNRTFFIINPDREIKERLRDFVERWKKCGRLVHRASQSPRSSSAASITLEATDFPTDRSIRMQAAELAPDPVVEAYKRDIDRTLLRQNLRRSVEERVANLIALQRLALEARRAGSSRKGAPPGLPFEWNEAAVGRGLNFTLTSGIGDIDLLGEITGGGDYDSLLPRSVEVELFGCRCRCLDLPGLIRTKRATRRPRDLEALAELEALLEERERDSNE